MIPDLSHLSYKDYKNVYDYINLFNRYEPSDDSYLMIDAFQKDIEKVTSNKDISLVLELGSGSGVLSSDSPSLYYLAIDINPDACSITKSTFKQNNLYCYDVINCNLLDNVLPQIHNKVDVFIFNPPYVSTPTDEVGLKDITASYAGGKNGREVLDKVIPHLNKILSDNGVGYIVVEKINNIDDIRNVLEKYEIKTKIIINRKARNEDLSILKISKNLIYL